MKALTKKQVEATYANINTYLDDEDTERVDKFYLNEYQPSTDWAQGGPIIEKYGIFSGPHCDIFIAWTDGTRWEGPTQLIAAMRCYVAGKLGDEVEIPAELLA